MVKQRLILWLSVIGLLACGPGPDGKSGGDGHRHEAQVLPLDEWVTDGDGVNYGTGDRTDWKKAVLPRAGTLYVQIACDNKDAHINAALFNKYGQLLIQKQKKKGVTDHIRFEGEVASGNYFIQIQARSSGDKTIYTIRASMEGGAGIGNIPRPE